MKKIEASVGEAMVVLYRQLKKVCASSLCGGTFTLLAAFFFRFHFCIKLFELLLLISFCNSFTSILFFYWK